MRSRFPALVMFAALLAVTPSLFADDWLPVTAADLGYTDKSGASAVILYLEDSTGAPVSVDGGRIEAKSFFFRSFYVRIKVLTDEGKKWANLEIPYASDFTRIEDLKARVIQPDGTIVPFTGQIYDKTVVKYRVVKVQEKTLTLPDVKAGSILEYRYTMRWGNYILDTSWELQGELWIKKAHFAIRPYTGFANVPLRLSWIGINLPAGLQPVKQGDIWSMDLTDVPPVPDEQYQPPEEWGKMTLRFIYSSDPDANLDDDAYWRKKSTLWADGIEKFLSKHKAVDEEAARLVQPGDTPEAKLRKFYARAQQIRNLSFEPERSDKEYKQEKLKDNNNVDDVLKHGYGHARSVNLLFIALARAAGLDATYVLVAQRHQHVFFKNIHDVDQLNDNIAMVNVNGKDRFFDPATLYCPYGLLSWPDTDAAALPITRSGGGFIRTTLPLADDAVQTREATLHYVDGRLEGTVRLSWRGLEALRWRLDERNNDEAGRKKVLEDQLRGWLPSGSKVDLTSMNGWKASDEPLVADFHVSVEGEVTPTGKRLLVSEGFFQANDVHPFSYASRRLPVYFSFPFRVVDSVTIDIPEGYRAEGTSSPRELKQGGLGFYQHKTTVAENKIHVDRQLEIDRYLLMPDEYAGIRSFYDVVRAGDQETMVLQVAKP